MVQPHATQNSPKTSLIHHQISLWVKYNFCCKIPQDFSKLLLVHLIQKVQTWIRPTTLPASIRLPSFVYLCSISAYPSSILELKEVSCEQRNYQRLHHVDNS